MVSKKYIPEAAKVDMEYQSLFQQGNDLNSS